MLDVFCLFLFFLLQCLFLMPRSLIVVIVVNVTMKRINDDDAYWLLLVDVHI